jgi:hypothetical protein
MQRGYLHGAALAAVLLLSPTIAPGQIAEPAGGEIALTQQLALDAWSLGYPEGWVQNVQQLPVVATDVGAVATMQRNAPLPPGGVAIGIIPPGGYGALGLPELTSAEEGIVALAGVFGGDGTVEPFAADRPAFTRALVGTTRVPPATRLVAFEVGGSVFSLLVVAEDFDATIVLLQAMIASAVVSGG